MDLFRNRAQVAGLAGMDPQLRPGRPNDRVGSVDLFEYVCTDGLGISPFIPVGGQNHDAAKNKEEL